MSEPAQHPSDHLQREGGLGSRRAQREGRSNNGPRHRRRQLQEFRAQTARHTTLESPDGWSITAADSAVHNSLWHGVKTDVEHSEASLAVTSVDHDKSQLDGIGAINGRQHNSEGCSNSSASSVATDDQSLCLLCCEPIKVVAVGKCNHKEICSECILQMVMLYKNSQCPLCKSELDQIVITPWVDPEPPDWSHWASILHQLWHKPQWCPKFFVSRDLFPGRYQPLHAYFQRLTARACSICDPEAEHLFRTDGALCKHMTQHHHRHLCMVCLKAGGRAFPLRLPTYTAQELDAHIAGDHPKCQFCGTHFYEREQWEMHMMANHPYCELCDADFRNAEEFTEHLRRSHWLCSEPSCEGCFVAFESKQELQEHHRLVHAPLMPHLPRTQEQHLSVEEVLGIARPHRRSRQAHGNDHTGGAGASAAAGPATAAGQVAHSPEDVLTHQLMLLLTSAHRGFTSHEAMTQLTGDVIAAAVRAANQANADGHPAGSQPPVPRQPASYSPSDPIPSPPISVSVPERDFLLLESVLLGVTAAQAPNTLRPPSDVSGSQGSRSVSVLPDGPAAPVGPVPSLGRGRGEGRSRGSYNEPSQMGAATAAAASQPLDLSLAAFPPLGHQPSRGAAWSTRPTPQGFSAQPQANQLSSEAFPELAAAANAAQPAASRQRRGA